MATITAKMGKLSSLRPPLPNELNSEAEKAWSELVCSWMNNVVKPDPKLSYVITQSFNPLDAEHDLEQKGAPITWTAFPALIAGDDSSNAERWKKADESRGGKGNDPGTQDEYSEWSVNRDSNGRITDVTFTSEGPEYWKHFVQYQPQDAIKVIEEMNGIKGVKIEELLDENGQYNKKNKYNVKTSGPIISLVHDASELTAEVKIVADATVLREKNGIPVTDKDELIECARYGAPGRNSDPEIGVRVNGFARDGYKVQIKDPVAIYIHSINKGNFKLNMTGDEEDQDLQNVPASWWIEQRGNFKNAQGLRFKIQNKSGAKATGENQNGRLLDVSDIWDDAGGEFVKYGAQFADHIKIGATGILAPGTKGKSYACQPPRKRVAASAVSTITSAVAAAVGAQDDEPWYSSRY